MASPPPRRVDDTQWHEGLVVTGGGRFDPANPPKDGRVDPRHGIAPLGQPDPKTIALDRWLAVPALPPTRALTRTFAMDRAIRPLSFLSVPYPDPSINGTRLEVAGVDYYCAQGIDLDRPIDAARDGDWIAVSLDRFFPTERASADFIVQVEPGVAQPEGRTTTVAGDAALTYPVTAAWTITDPDPDATSASRSSPGSL